MSRMSAQVKQILFVCICCVHMEFNGFELNFFFTLTLKVYHKTRVCGYIVIKGFILIILVKQDSIENSIFVLVPF